MSDLGHGVFVVLMLAAIVGLFWWAHGADVAQQARERECRSAGGILVKDVFERERCVDLAHVP